MCGIAGILRLDAELPTTTREVLEAMGAVMRQRGPDDQQTWIDLPAGIAFVHRRLAIVDLTPTGRQPMISASGRYTLVFNGEIYNHAELRRTLEAAGAALRGTSDTEVLLESIALLGLAETLATCVGMFAFALWDGHERSLHLTRDRFGEKPLYFGVADGRLAFASDLRCFAQVPGFARGIEPSAIGAFLANGYVPAPLSIWHGISKLPPGCTLRIAHGGPTEAPVPYWSPTSVAMNGARAPFIGNLDAACDELDRLLGRAVDEQLCADVPVGCFLSGGIDSSLITALAMRRSRGAVKTFTISFAEAHADESTWARAVATALGSEHSEHRVVPADAIAATEQLHAWYGEPFADASQVPTALLCAAARQRVTVALSGDGADELFGGYGRYRHIRRAWDLVGWAPGGLRRASAAALGCIPSSVVRCLLAPADRLAGRRSIENPPSEKALKSLQLLAQPDLASMYRALMARSGSAELLAPEVRDACIWMPPPPLTPAAGGTASWAMLNDQRDYLPDDILVKVDRAAMAHSLETRAPFLDHRVAEFAWRLPEAWKVGHSDGKPLLKHLLARYLDRRLFERPKMGFAMPFDDWLVGPLRPWADELLLGYARTCGWLAPVAVERTWRAFLAGHVRLRYRVWDLLMLTSWLRAQSPAQARARS